MRSTYVASCAVLALLAYAPVYRCIRVDDTVTAHEDGAVKTFPNLQAQSTSPLVPALVPGGHAYTFVIKEKCQMKATTDYQWEFAGQKVAALHGSWTSSMFGHQSVHVTDNTGAEVFKFRKEGSNMNGVYDYRVVPAGGKNNTDFFFKLSAPTNMFNTETWKITQRDGREVYHCTGNCLGWTYKCWTSKAAHDSSQPAVATIVRRVTKAPLVDGDWLPDNHQVRVQPGQDSALILVFASIIGMTHDPYDTSHGDPYQGYQDTNAAWDYMLGN
jgi:hypothetical protein